MAMPVMRSSGMMRSMAFFITKLPAPSERRKRFALLNAEADIQREVAAERARSVQTKASFLVVIAGLLAGASFDTPWDSEYWLFSAVPLALALATVVAAVIALWPAPAGS